MSGPLKWMMCEKWMENIILGTIVKCNFVNFVVSFHDMLAVQISLSRMIHTCITSTVSELLPQSKGQSSINTNSQLTKISSLPTFLFHQIILWSLSFFWCGYEPPDYITCQEFTISQLAWNSKCQRNISMYLINTVWIILNVIPRFYNLLQTMDLLCHD